MNVQTWGMNKFNITLEEMDTETQILEIEFKEDTGSNVLWRIYSGIDHHFSDEFLKLFNIKMVKRNA